MGGYLMSLGVDIWMFVEDIYKTTTTPLTYPNGRRGFKNNAKEKNKIMCDLS